MKPVVPKTGQTLPPGGPLDRAEIAVILRMLRSRFPLETVDIASEVGAAARPLVQSLRRRGIITLAQRTPFFRYELTEGGWIAAAFALTKSARR